MTPARRLVVIGAGPIGLAAALGGARRGWDVTVLERARVGASLLGWGPTRFFSPLAMNLPPGVPGPDLPGDALLTGPEYVARVLEPLAAGLRVELGHTVVGVGRAGLARGDLAGHPVRAERPFQLLVETPAGETCVEAEAVLDASGASTPVLLGAPGERALAAIRALGALHERRAELAGKRILLVGHGHSAATALLELAGVAVEAAGTSIVWATRTANLRPCLEVASDPLPGRQRLVAAANALAARPPPWLRVERRAVVQAFAAGPRALLRGGRTVDFDTLIALTGYRPDLSFLSELALEIAPATEGAARLAAALARVTDCLSVPAVGAADLASGEPGFHLVGAKSYGRARTFLLRSGHAQLERILDGLQAR
jgi:thioredoxin reductase